MDHILQAVKCISCRKISYAIWIWFRSILRATVNHFRGNYSQFKNTNTPVSYTSFVNKQCYSCVHNLCCYFVLFTFFPFTTLDSVRHYDFNTIFTCLYLFNSTMQLIEDVQRVMVGVNKSWSKVLPDATSVLISSFVLYNSINQLVQASDPTNDKWAVRYISLSNNP